MKKIISALAIGALTLFANDKVVDVYESPTCGCCDLWADYMKTKGYEVRVHKTEDFLKIKEEYKIKDIYQSCHTGIIDGYAIEGHVPEDAVAWLLENKPKDVIGISAPGMPQGSPGMEQGYEEKYPVIVMLKNGDYKIYGIYKGHQLLEKN
ncbi:DUF411 domain-containing protein [Campylobacter volucris]|uniref:DUF411 domain-containing protein n=1 Tax=Campylobacter volucris TaxID=1031542 RepID=A0AAE5YH11_9BACT|nr:DUF411 domain-containing protein [Campylobacter volucris]AJC93868.1 hypothetical protein (DUF411 domain) [Campylobacter volucris LMG 24379]KAB0580031.1 DUF411 domain-containing protein [Campylobacter volucris]QBL13754.1 DUF411 domain-containing protein [Campylobacter volucris]QEL08081.1 DUF411 domain-containing protein [Campylobacter volucris]TDJ80784.1 DUF411 domain-containing protein [Campylobacter volucris]